MTGRGVEARDTAVPVLSDITQRNHLKQQSNISCDSAKFKKQVLQTTIFHGITNNKNVLMTTDTCHQRCVPKRFLFFVQLEFIALPYSET